MADEPKIKINIISQEDAEQSEFVVCSPVSFFPDDVTGECSLCSVTVFSRPHSPQKPPKLCIACWKEQPDFQEAGAITKEGIDDVRKYFRRKIQ